MPETLDPSRIVCTPHCRWCGRGLAGPSEGFCNNSHRMSLRLHVESVASARTVGYLQSCPTPERRYVEDQGSAILLAAAIVRSYECVCGGFHLGPVLQADPLKVPHCLWCDITIVTEGYLHCTTNHRQKRKRANKAKKERGYPLGPCLHPEKESFSTEGQQ